MDDLPQTVRDDLYGALADAISPEFAGSYLSGATDDGEWVTPWTQVAWRKLTKDRDAMGAIVGCGRKLIKPLVFGHPDRPDTQRRR